MLIHADNFNIYGFGGTTALMLNGRYSEVGGCSIVSDPDGVSVPHVLRLIGGFGGTTNVRRAVKVPTNKIGHGMRMWLGSLPSDDSQRPTMMFWNDASNRGMCRIIVNTTGSITAQVFDITSGAFGDWYDLATTTGPVVTANAWWQLEGAFDADLETFELRVEGRPVITCDSTDFAGHLHNGPNIYQCGFYSQQNFIGAAIAVYVKDYFWWDNQGTRNIDFLGACLVAELVPDGDEDLGGWVPSVGTTAWEILDTTAPGDTPFVAAETPPPDPVIMTMTDLPPDITSVKGIMTVVRATKVDGGDGNLQVSLLHNTDTADGDDRPITAAMTYWEDVFEVDPSTGTYWTPGAVDDARIKLNRTV